MRVAPLLGLVARILCTALVFAAGCSRSPTARFYTLHALTDVEREGRDAAVEGGIAIGVGPIEFPRFLDRPQIVTRVSPNEVSFAEFHRWAAASLKDDFSSKLARNLSILLATSRVAPYPWTSTTPVDVQVKIDVIRFDGHLGRDVVLQTRWALFGEDPTHPLLSKASSLREAVDGQGYGALVEAQSRALAGLSREIAEAIRRLLLQGSSPSSRGN